MRLSFAGSLIFLFFDLLLVRAQTNCNITFSGTIRTESGQRLPGAILILQPKQIGIEGDSLGNFRMEKLCPGRYSIVIQYPGFEELNTEILIDQNTRRNFVLKESVQQLEEVVIEEKALDTEHSQNYSQLDEKQLAESAGKSLGETLKEIPGVNTIQSGPGIFKPVIHGVHSQRILILNYGIRQEGQQWGAEHAPEIDPFIASNIVVIKDASSIKYGTDAIGGVIVVNPPALPTSAGVAGTINTVMQSNGRSATLAGMLEGGIKKASGWGWRIQGSGKRSGDFQTPDYSLTNTGVKELNYSGAMGYHNNRLGVEGYFSHFETTLGILKGTAINNQEDLDAAMERTVPAYTSDFSYSIDAPRQHVSHNLFKINSHIKVNHGQVTVQYGLQKNHREEFDMRIGPLSKTPALNLELTTQTLDAELEKSHADKRTICVGITSMYQRNSTVFGTRRIPFIPNYDNVSSGVYSVVKFYSNRWTVDLGARYDFRYYMVSGYDFKNSLFKANMLFNNVSATSGATIRLAKNQQFNINLSSTWRPPSVAELYSIGTHQSAAANEYGLLLSDQTNEVRSISNVNFKPEQAIKLVTTYSRQWQHFQLEVSPYLNYIFNYIYLRPAGISQTIRATLPYFRYSQTDALFLGTDISGVWKISKTFSALPKVSLLRASDITHNDFLLYIPSNRYEVALRYDQPKLDRVSKFYLESKLKYVAHQGRAPRVITTRQINEAIGQNQDLLKDNPRNFDFMAAPDGYFLLSVATGFSIHREHSQFDFRLACENATNERYREYTNRFRYYANEVGRNFILSMKCIF
jgi:iron complex outermembrane receptor protein